ncbi:MAG: hypothetical protein IJX39_05090 [Clostridia bacterium]|nr:hypothetical protein [Clostridia bacterium]
MNKKREPTDGDNVTSRLFLRFFICYLIATPVAVLCALRGVLQVSFERAGLVEFLFVPLALLGALLTVTKPYLLLLSAAKAFYDVAILYQVTQWTRLGAIGILPWNACFFLLVFSLLLFSLAAARAELFSFLCTARDTRLIFSRPFGRYLLEGLLFTALALSLYYLVPEILATFGMISIPFS